MTMSYSGNEVSMPFNNTTSPEPEVVYELRAPNQGFQGGAPNILIWFALVCGNTRARISKPLRIKAELFSP
jgi:hypothetical protein